MNQAIQSDAEEQRLAEDARPGPSPLAAMAHVDDEGRLALEWLVTAYRPNDPAVQQGLPFRFTRAAGDETVTAAVVRRFSLLDVQGFRTQGTKLEEIELRTLAGMIRHSLPVIVCRAEERTAGLDVMLRLVKDGTVVLILQKPPRKPIPPPWQVPLPPPPVQ